MSEQYQLLIYGVTTPNPLGYMRPEQFMATVTAKDKEDQKRLYRNYKRQIARNKTRTRRQPHQIDRVEYVLSSD